MPGADGTTQRDHILEVCKQTGKTPEELGVSETSLDEEIPIPEDGLYLGFYFQELSGGRINSGFGPTALSWSDMEAWARLTSTPLTPYEILTLRSMDTAFLSAHAAETEKRNKNTKGKP